MLLSDMQCRAAKPRLKPFKLSDGKGLYLEVMPSGAKYWRLKYHYNGTEKRISFGSYPAISLQEAREKRTSAKKEITTGQDPILVRLQEKQTRLFNASQTFERIALEWHEKEAAAWNERYAKLVLHRLEKYVFPDLGKFPINMIRPIMVLNCLQKIEVTAPDIARRMKQHCHFIFLYAIATERLQTDPTYGLQHALKKYRKGHFAAITVDEVPNFIIWFFDKIHSTAN